MRSLADALVFLTLLAMVLFAMRQAGFLAPETGTFAAIDGDSLRKDGAEYRLHAIDAPELHQMCETASGNTYPCGRAAQQALHALVAGKPLNCQILETDRYGRGIATCLEGPLVVNAEMVRLGWAVAYRRNGLDYLGEEAQAKQARRGIWQGRFEDPEDWRARQRSELMRGGMTADDAMQD